MHGAQYFTKLNLCSAYNLVRIREGDEWKTAFSTGHYEYRVMPYGLTNAPLVFQFFINEVFRDMFGRCVVVYIDKILVYSTTCKQHVSHVRSVLERLISQGGEVPFLPAGGLLPGQSDINAGVEMEENRVSAVRLWPVQSNIKAVQRFLVFSNYFRCFIRGFSHSGGSSHLPPEGRSQTVALD
jgi:hypothetical protein